MEYSKVLKEVYEILKNSEDKIQKKKYLLNFIHF